MKSWIALLTCVIIGTVAFGQSAFRKMYHESLSLGLVYDIEPTADNNYVILGHNNDTKACHILKIDNNGNSIWATNVTFLETTWPKEVKEASDGSFYVLTANAIGGKNRPVVIKLTASGAVSWVKEYEHAFDKLANDIDVTSDNGIIITTDKSGNNYFLKIDSSGSIVWSGETGVWLQEAYSKELIVDNDDNIYVASRAFDTGGGDDGIQLLKMNSTGGFLWSKYYDIGNTGDGLLLIEDFVMENDQLWIVANVQSTSFVQDIFLMRADTTGNINLGKRYSFSDSELAKGIAILGNNKYAIAGEIYVGATLNMEQFIMEVDELGVIQYANTFHDSTSAGTGFQGIYQITESLDGGVIMGGSYDWGMEIVKSSVPGGVSCNEYAPLTFTTSALSYNLDLTNTDPKEFTPTFTVDTIAYTETSYTAIIETACDSAINIGTAVYNKTTIPDPKIYVDRNTKVVHIEGAKGYHSVTVTSMDGKIVEKLYVIRSNHDQIDLSHLYPSLYIITLTSDKKSYSRKIVIL